VGRYGDEGGIEGRKEGGWREDNGIRIGGRQNGKLGGRY
jgi:hypothetical protein